MGTMEKNGRTGESKSAKELLLGNRELGGKQKNFQPLECVKNQT